MVVSVFLLVCLLFSPFLGLSVALSLCLLTVLSHCRFVSLSLILYVSMSLSNSLSLSHTLLSLFLSISLSGFPFISLSVSFSGSPLFFPSLCLLFCLSLWFFLCCTVRLPFSSLWRSLCHNVCLYFFCNWLICNKHQIVLFLQVLDNHSKRLLIPRSIFGGYHKT